MVLLCLAQTTKAIFLPENLTLLPLFSQHVFSINTLIMLSLTRILRQEKDLLDHQNPFLHQPEGTRGHALLGKSPRKIMKKCVKFKWYTVPNFQKFLRKLPGTVHNILTLLNLGQWISTGVIQLLSPLWRHFTPSETCLVDIAWGKGSCFRNLWGRSQGHY